jgi:hypothetical protein
VLGLLDEIKGTLPQEIKQARNIVTERNNVLASAQREAEIIKRNAEEMGRRLVSEQEVLTVATKKANDKLAEAETRAREVRRATNEYVDNALKRTEDAMAQALNEVRQSRSEFRQAIAKPAPKDKHKG